MDSTIYIEGKKIYKNGNTTPHKAKRIDLIANISKSP